jgi:hypothetical protein
VRWPSACEDVSPGAQECPRLSQLRVGVERSEKLLAEAENPEEGERQLLEATTKQRLLKTKKTLCVL